MTTLQTMKENKQDCAFIYSSLFQLIKYLQYLFIFLPMFSSPINQKGVIFKGNYRILPEQVRQLQFGCYMVCEELQIQKKYMCKIFGVFFLDNIFAKDKTKLKKYIDIQAKAAQYEFNISKNLKHRNIVNLNNRLIDKNNVYLFYDYCNRGTLRNLLKNKYEFSKKQLLNAFHQLIQGLIYLHQNSLQHLEISPDNILIESYGQTKIYKLGNFSKLRRMNVQINEEQEMGSQQSERYLPFASDINYRAPELEQDYFVRSFKSDVWSLGVVFYQMTLGKLPWKNIDKNQLSCQIREYSLPKQSIAPFAITNLLQDMLQKQTKRRISLEQTHYRVKKLFFLF